MGTYGWLVDRTLITHSTSVPKLDVVPATMSAGEA
jgi:hypothetical protein